MPIPCDINSLPDRHITPNLTHICRQWNWQSLYKNYVWGIDTYDAGYPGIRTLEHVIPRALRSRRFNVGTLLLIKCWGAPGHTTLSNIRRNLGITNVQRIYHSVIRHDGALTQTAADNPGKTIAIIQQQCHGFGPTYSSKLLRFASSKEFGAIDTRIARHYGPAGLNWLPFLHLDHTGHAIDTQQGWPESYTHWINILRYIADRLNNTLHVTCPYPIAFIRENLRPPERLWYLADVEMALFARASGAGIHTQPREKVNICPRCGSPVVWRTAQKTGEQYLGCENWPACKWNTRSY